jgi:tetratricopeptide (TPR) repeat protein
VGIEAFTRAIELDPKYPLAYSNRGVAYGKLGDHQKEIRDYDKAIELDPKYAVAYLSRGIAYMQLKDSRNAIMDFKIAARLGLEPAQDMLKSMGISW